MFDDDDDFAENKLNEDIEYFEAHLKGDSIGFMESDRLEALIDHYLLVGTFIDKIRITFDCLIIKSSLIITKRNFV